jgi:PKD repeat protein
VATIPLSLYNRLNPGDTVGGAANQNRFLLDQNGGSPPQPCSAANVGDTLDISLFFLDDVGGSSPYLFHRYAGATVEVNLASFGGGVHVYAQAFSTTEIVPVTGISVTRSALGAANTVEKQRIIFNGTPFGGTFTIKFRTPPDGGSGIEHRAQLFADLTVPWNIGAADLQARIRALASYYAFTGNGNQEAGPVGLNYFTSAGVVGREPIVTAITGGFEIQFGTLQGFPGDPTGHYNTWCQHIPLIQAQDFNLQYAYGYSVSLPLTDAAFTDLFLNSHAPAFLDVLLTPAGGVAGLTGQLPLVASDPSTAPVANFSSNVSVGTAPLTVQFNDSSTNTPTAWAWNFGDGGTSTARNPSHIYAGAGTYTVTLTATNAFGADGETKTNYITVSPPTPGIGETTDAAYVDGNWATPQAVDCPLIEQPFPEQPTALILSQRYWQWRLYWAPAPLSMPCPFAGDAVLIRETKLVSLGGADLVEWERFFATVPAPIVDYDMVTYTFQQYYLAGPNYQIDSWMLTRRAKITRTFFLTSSPDSISVARLPRAVVLHNVLYTLDGFTNLASGTTTIACDDTLTRWNGDIWVRTHWEITI